MKKLIIGSLLSLFACTSFAAEENKFKFSNFVKSTDKRGFFRDMINHSPPNSKEFEKQKCNAVNKGAILVEMRQAVIFQVSCTNIKDDIHIIYPTDDSLEAIISTCEYMKTGAKPPGQCLPKLNY